MRKFFDLLIENEHLNIGVIKSVQEMQEEGTAMHHCVFEMGYYKRDNTLILSARDKAGNRIETIEINLETYKIVQSRGVCNSNTAYHEEIIELINNNMNKIIKKAA